MVSCHSVLSNCQTFVQGLISAINDEVWWRKWLQEVDLPRSAESLLGEFKFVVLAHKQAVELYGDGGWFYSLLGRRSSTRGVEVEEVDRATPARDRSDGEEQETIVVRRKTRTKRRAAVIDAS